MGKEENQQLFHPSLFQQILQLLIAMMMSRNQRKKPQLVFHVHFALQVLSSIRWWKPYFSQKGYPFKICHPNKFGLLGLGGISDPFHRFYVYNLGHIMTAKKISRWAALTLLFATREEIILFSSVRWISTVAGLLWGTKQDHFVPPRSEFNNYVK